MTRRRSIPESQLELWLADSQLAGAESDAMLAVASNEVAGVDEVGRGALFGPVVAAAVVLPEASLNVLAQAGVTDSKLLTPQARQALVQQIRAMAVSCCIGVASVREIDRLNILQASLLAMRRAIARLQPQPKLCLIDGNQRVPNLQIPQQTIVQGDQRSLQIAAASIVAKVWRDELITRLAARYPYYDLANNKGYGTAAHRRGLEAYGPSSQHRRSFSPCQKNRLPKSDNLHNIPLIPTNQSD